MSMLMKPQKGARPWIPADDVTVVEELDRHDFPLAGLIEQGGRPYLFTVLLGETSDVSVWGYVEVEDRQVKELTHADDLDAFDAAVVAALAYQPVLVALSAGWELRDWTMIDAGEEGPSAIAHRFLARMQRQIDKSQEDVTQLEREFEAIPG